MYMSWILLDLGKNLVLVVCKVDDLEHINILDP